MNSPFFYAFVLIAYDRDSMAIESLLLMDDPQKLKIRESPLKLPHQSPTNEYFEFVKAGKIIEK